MNKRDWMKWLGFGAFAAPIGFIKSAEAAKPDWRDELLNMHSMFTVYYNRVHDEKEFETRTYSTKSIAIMQNGRYDSENSWTNLPGYFIIHNHYYSGRNINEKFELEGHDTKFDTLEEAYKYAKQLKEKYYG